MKYYKNISIYKLITFCGSFFLFTLFFFLFTVPVYAANQALSITPIIIKVPLSPGKIYSHEITVQNLTDTPLPLRATLNDFQTTGEEGGYIFPDTKTNPLLSWVTLSDVDMILKPKEYKKITITIKTPTTIPLGGYYGMLFFEPLMTGKSASGTQVTSKIGVLMLANIGVPDPKAKNAEIVTYSTGFFHENGQIPLLLRVKNTSLHYFTAKPILKISPIINLLKTQEKPIYLEEKILFQGKIRRWEQLFDLNLKPNIYKAHMVVSTGNGQTIEDNQYFLIFPFTKTILVILILLNCFLIIKHKKRLKKAISAFLSNTKSE